MNNSGLRILHIIDSLDTGGAEAILAGTVEGLTKHHHVIALLNPVNKYQSQTKSAVIYDLNYNSKLDIIRCIYSLHQIIRKHKIEIIHSHLLSSTMLARLLNSRLPLIFSVHNILSKSAFRTSNLSKWIEKLLYKKSNKALFVSSEVKRDYEKFIDIKGDYAVLPNFISDAFFSKKKRKEKSYTSPIRLIAVGSLKPQKNYPFLISALKDINNVILDIYGEGPERVQLSQLIKDEELDDRINLKGNLSSIDQVICNYDIFVMASSYEGFGISACEAMAAGLPVLLANLPVFREIAKGVSTLYKPNDIEDFISKLDYIISNPDEVSLKIDAARKRMHNLYSKQKYMLKLSQIYSDCAEQNKNLYLVRKKS